MRSRLCSFCSKPYCFSAGVALRPSPVRAGDGQGYEPFLRIYFGVSASHCAARYGLSALYDLSSDACASIGGASLSDALIRDQKLPFNR